MFAATSASSGTSSKTISRTVSTCVILVWIRPSPPPGSKSPPPQEKFYTKFTSSATTFRWKLSPQITNSRKTLSFSIWKKSAIASFNNSWPSGPSSRGSLMSSMPFLLKKLTNSKTSLMISKLHRSNIPNLNLIKYKTSIGLLSLPKTSTPLEHLRKKKGTTKICLRR